MSERASERAGAASVPSGGRSLCAPREAVRLASGLCGWLAGGVAGAPAWLEGWGAVGRAAPRGQGEGRPARQGADLRAGPLPSQEAGTAGGAGRPPRLVGLPSGLPGAPRGLCFPPATARPTAEGALRAGRRGGAKAWVASPLPSAARGAPRNPPPRSFADFWLL